MEMTTPTNDDLHHKMSTGILPNIVDTMKSGQRQPLETSDLTSSANDYICFSDNQGETNADKDTIWCESTSRTSNVLIKLSQNRLNVLLYPFSLFIQSGG
jgi:hypothetical protein